MPMLLLPLSARLQGLTELSLDLVVALVLDESAVALDCRLLAGMGGITKATLLYGRALRNAAALARLPALAELTLPAPALGQLPRLPGVTSISGEQLRQGSSCVLQKAGRGAGFGGAGGGAALPRHRHAVLCAAGAMIKVVKCGAPSGGLSLHACMATLGFPSRGHPFALPVQWACLTAASQPRPSCCPSTWTLWLPACQRCAR